MAVALVLLLVWGLQLLYVYIDIDSDSDSDSDDDMASDIGIANICHIAQHAITTPAPQRVMLCVGVGRTLSVNVRQS